MQVLSRQGKENAFNKEGKETGRALLLCQQRSISQGYGFPVVMYGCENWTVQKAERWRIDAFVVLEKTLESPLDCKEIQPIHPKGDQS